MIIVLIVFILASSLLYGLYVVKSGLRNVKFDLLNRFILSMTGTHWRAFVFGVIMGMILDNGPVAVMITAGFVSVKILPFSQSLGIILGINMGGVMYVLPFGYEHYVAPMALIGASLCYVKSRKIVSFGYVLIGIAIMLGATWGLEQIWWLLMDIWELSFQLKTVVGFNGVESLLVLLAIISTSKEAHYMIWTYVLLNILVIIFYVLFVDIMKVNIPLNAVEPLLTITISLIALPLANPFGRFVKKLNHPQKLGL